MEQDACHKAFANMKLRERILLHLPLKDILFSQRMCKQWRRHVQSSTPIKQVLFLEPYATTRLEWTDKPERLMEWPRPAKHGTYFIDEDTGAAKENTGKAVLNPLIQQYTKYGELKLEGLIIPEKANFYDGGLDCIKRNLYAVHACQSASWRQMLYIQPAQRRMQFLCKHTEGGSDEGSERLFVSSPNVLRLGDIVTQLRDHWLRECPDCLSWRDGDCFDEEEDEDGEIRRWGCYALTATDPVKADITGWDMLAGFRRRGW